MRVAIVPFPMLFQRDAALQAQVRETMRALQTCRGERQVQLTIVPPDADPGDIDAYDAVHVFSASGANQRWIAMAAAARVPLVFSPLLAPGTDPANADPGLRRALDQAALLVALGKNEMRAIASGFPLSGAPVRLMATGISAQQFDADGDLFRLRTGIRGPFVLMAGSFTARHQQLALARLLTAQGMPVVLLGETRARGQELPDACQAMPGVTCLGGLAHDPAMLNSAYAAASVLVLAGQGDASVRDVLDTLATGTPVVLSGASPIDVPSHCGVLRHVMAGDVAARERAVFDLLAAPPPRERVRALVRPLSWERAALQLAACYGALARCDAPLAA